MLVSLDVSTLAHPDSKFINLRAKSGNIVYGYYINTNDKSLWSIKSGTLKPLKKQKPWGLNYRTLPEGYDISTNGRQQRIGMQQIKDVIATTPKKPEPVLLDESTKQQVEAWEAVCKTLQVHAPGWNDSNGLSTTQFNACKAIDVLANDSKALQNMVQNKVPGELYIRTLAPDVEYRKSGIFCYDIKKCTTAEDVKSELERVRAKFEIGLMDDEMRTTEVVDIDLVGRKIKMRYFHTLTKEKIAEYAQMKLQQIINDYIGEQK